VGASLALQGFAGQSGKKHSSYIAYLKFCLSKILPDELAKRITLAILGHQALTIKKSKQRFFP